MFRQMQKIFKILTLSITLLSALAFSADVEQKKFKTHLRWLLDSAKGQLDISQNSNQLLIKTLDLRLFKKIKSEMIKFKTESSYIKSVSFDSSGLPSRAARIEATLANKSIESFSFYKDADRKYIVDFWINEDLVVKKADTVIKKQKTNQKNSQLVKKTLTKKVTKKNIVKNKIIKKNIRKKKKIARDFRYGAPFMWNLDASLPDIKKDVNLYLKAPNYFYEVQDRDLTKGEKETHMQLSINFYRKSKWGLMTKSISLYEKKYGFNEINEFMKAVSLIKNQINPKISNRSLQGKGTFEAALNILKNISAKTKNNKIKNASLRYILQAALDKNDYIASLALGKELYVLATEDFDDKMIIYSSKVILNSLAKLKQVSKIEEFLKNKAVMRVLPRQIGFAYKSYIYLKNGKEEKLIKEYETRQSAMIRPIHPTIAFNIAESYFRLADFEKAIGAFDNYIADYSYMKNASEARLRLAQSYDLSGKKFSKVSELYKSAINKASNPKIRYESKIRYVGHSVLRKLNLNENDLEKLVFLDQDEEESKMMDKKLSKLLWLVRMRSLIIAKKYDEALAYLSSIPLLRMSSIDKSVFDADGAEIVLGVVKKAYLSQNYAKAIKVWNVYKSKYVEKVAKSSYLRFLVTDSYLKLGLERSFNESMAILSLMKKDRERDYPRWISIHKNINPKDLLIDVKVAKFIKDRLWTKLDNYLETVKNRKSINYNFYKGLVSYKRGFYNKAVRSYEKVIVAPNLTNTLSPLENKMMQSNYIESLYESASAEKFRKNTEAMLIDLRNNSKLNTKLIERSEYLVIESLFDSKNSSLQVGLKANKFLNEFEKSSYAPRVKYINAMNYLEKNELKKGKIILEELLKEKDTPEYLKGLARSELTGLVLESKNI